MAPTSFRCPRARRTRSRRVQIWRLSRTSRCATATFVEGDGWSVECVHTPGAYLQSHLLCAPRGKGAVQRRPRDGLEHHHRLAAGWRHGAVSAQSGWASRVVTMRCTGPRTVPASTIRNPSCGLTAIIAWREKHRFCVVWAMASPASPRWSRSSIAIYPCRCTPRRRGRCSPRCSNLLGMRAGGVRDGGRNRCHLSVRLVISAVGDFDGAE